MKLEIVVYGHPAPQGSKSPKGRTKTGRVVLVESSKYVGPWRDDVKAAAERAIAHLRGAVCPLDQPLAYSMVFTVRKPKSAPKNRVTRPSKYPDLSKLLRSTEDALTAAGVWADDSLVVRFDYAEKVYPREHPEALETEGARIVVRTLDEQPTLFEATP